MSVSRQKNGVEEAQLEDNGESDQWGFDSKRGATSKYFLWGKELAHGRFSRDNGFGQLYLPVMLRKIHKRYWKKCLQKAKAAKSP